MKSERAQLLEAEGDAYAENGPDVHIMRDDEPRDDFVYVGIPRKHAWMLNGWWARGRLSRRKNPPIDAIVDAFWQASRKPRA